MKLGVGTRYVYDVDAGSAPSSQLSPKSGQGNALPKGLSLRRSYRGVDLISDGLPFGRL
jgi:hypothetical protein